MAYLDTTGLTYFFTKLKTLLQSSTRALSPGTEITSSSNLNNYTTPGNYRVGSETVAKSLTNAPCKEAGALVIYDAIGSIAAGSSYKYITQEYTTLRGQRYTRYGECSPSTSGWEFGNWIEALCAGETTGVLAAAKGGTGRSDFGMGTAVISATGSDGSFSIAVSSGSNKVYAVATVTGGVKSFVVLNEPAVGKISGYCYQPGGAVVASSAVRIDYMYFTGN